MYGTVQMTIIERTQYSLQRTDIAFLSTSKSMLTKFFLKRDTLEHTD